MREHNVHGRTQVQAEVRWNVHKSVTHSANHLRHPAVFSAKHVHGILWMLKGRQWLALLKNLHTYRACRTQIDQRGADDLQTARFCMLSSALRAEGGCTAKRRFATPSRPAIQRRSTNIRGWWHRRCARTSDNRHNPWCTQHRSSSTSSGQECPRHTTNLKVREQTSHGRAFAHWGVEPHSPKTVLPKEVSLTNHH
jgi:hypothetical protein